MVPKDEFIISGAGGPRKRACAVSGTECSGDQQRSAVADSVWSLGKTSHKCQERREDRSIRASF